MLLRGKVPIFVDKVRVMVKEKAYPSADIRQISNRISDSEVITYLYSKKIDWSYMERFKELSSLKDEKISYWFSISVKTLRKYKNPEVKFRNNIKEKLILLLSLFKHGIEVFGDIKEFNAWLDSENFYFDGAKPDSFLTSVTGIRFVNDRLTAMEYGDNV